MRKSCVAAFIFSLLALPALGHENATFGQPVSTLVTVSFANSSSVFKPTPEQVEMLGAVKDASMISINGRTSTSQASAKDEALALMRAIAARAWLVARGVSPLKISINYASAADFITENSTPEGKYQNQRVDIEVFFVPKY